jgi:hypothetical protein
VVNLLAAGVITVSQAEAAAPVSAPTTGGAELEPPAPLRVEPAPEEQSASAPRRAKTATRADLGLTTAEKIVALAADACRWPYNDPRDRAFCFCSRPIARGSYCERHALQAHLAPRTGGGHGVFVTYGRHGRPSIPGTFSATGASRPPKILLDRAGGLPGSAPPPA